MEAERWLPIPGWPAYEVSDLGRVRKGARILRQSENYPGGYPRVALHGPSGFRTELVHILVLTAFVGPRPPGMFACHTDDNRNDNRLANLRWATPAENCADAVVNGRKRPPRVPIEDLGTMPDTALARLHGITHQAVSDLRRRHNIPSFTARRQAQP